MFIVPINSNVKCLAQNHRTGLHMELGLSRQLRQMGLYMDCHPMLCHFKWR